jgi:hypothetical protein
MNSTVPTPAFKKNIAIAEVVLITVLALAPLFGKFPYRFNIFLSYEGAYRMYLGQVPYKDFGMPVGYMYWVIPFVFFKLLGPYMISLVKAQVFINVVAGLSFRSILQKLQVPEGIRFGAVLLFVISYSFMNFWPWYNHTVIMYQLLGLAFLLQFIFFTGIRWRYIWLLASSVLLFFSFFTKQDAGAMGILIAIGLLAYHCWYEKNFKPMVVWLLGIFLTAALLIVPFLPYQFAYWFNYGQAPHTARVSWKDIAEDFFTINSIWIKFYVFAIALVLLAQQQSFKTIMKNKRVMIFALLTLGILVEAAIFQTTSYIPADNNIFFHSFAVAFILTMASSLLPIHFSSVKNITVLSLGIMLWFSHMYFKYISKYIVGTPVAITNTDGVVNKKTYLRLPEDTTDVPMYLWREVPNMPSFKGMLLPGPTVDGIARLTQLDIVQHHHPDWKVLNMTELTPLAFEMHFNVEKSANYPLWYHLGVGMFQKENDFFTQRIKNNYYDLVLFEHIPYLNNFYPWQVRAALLQYYKRVDVFTAPRKPAIQAWVEVYVRK